MIKQPDINSVFHPTFLGNRILAKPSASKKSSESMFYKNARQNVNQVASRDKRIHSAGLSTARSNSIVINVHLSGQKILQQFGWILAASLWGLVFAFFLMR